MKFTAAVVLAAATGAIANSNVTVVTEVVSSYVTYCPGPTTISHGSQTYTVTEPTTLTITDCPCTITRPVTTTTATVCNTCPPSQPGYTNSTAGVPPTTPGVPLPTGGVPSVTEPAPSSVPTAGAIKAGLSGVAGAVGLAAFFL